MQGERPVILLVDDQPTNLKALVAMLQTDYRVKAVTRGADALSLAAQEPQPDLILLDVMMPRMDGYAVCAALKDSPATTWIPVIFLTARTDAESETAALAGGAADFIHKPINPAVVRARIQLQLILQQRTRDLRRANAELARHRDHLEARVEARTLELAEARDAAEGANRAKTTFLRNVSHEMLTPLNHITGLSYLLRRELAPGRLQERLDGIDRAAHTLLDMVGRLLDLASLEASQLRLEPQLLAPRALLGQVARDHRERAVAKGLTLDLLIDPTVPELLIGDPVRLRQILDQLLDNAVKFSESGRIKLSVLTGERTPERIRLRFAVKDAGIGMPPAVAAKLFQDFQQGDDSLTREYLGLGLGLALCHRLVSLMGGEISLSSAPGQGTHVAFWVPFGLPGASAGVA